MKLSLAIYFVLFVIYSFCGWLLETTFCFYKTKKLVNRGFLIGPVCPIYGLGSVGIIFFFSRYEKDIVTLFVMAAVLCTILEYLTSYIMEKLFKARWWDYSNKKFNVNGRVCGENTIAFGILAILMIKFVNPFVLNLLDKLSRVQVNSIAIVLAVLLFTDFVMSYKIISGFKKTAKSIRKDSTEEITKKVREILIERGGLYKRLVSAFDFEASSKLILDFTTRIRVDAIKKAQALKDRNRDQNDTK